MDLGEVEALQSGVLSAGEDLSSLGDLLSIKSQANGSNNYKQHLHEKRAAYRVSGGMEEEEVLPTL